MKKTITEMFFDLPRSREYIEKLANGEKPENLVSNPEPSETDEQDSVGTWRAMSAEKEEEEKEEADEPEIFDENDEFIQNINESLQMVRGFAIGRGIDSDKLDEVLLSMFRMTNEIAEGKISVENIERILKGDTYDEDTTKARYEGEIAGRNARIEIEMRRAENSDGLPRMSGKSTANESPLPGSIFDLVRSAR